MLRAYIGGRNDRLHVWDDRYAVPGVSEMHTHPWHLVSLVIAGKVANQRFLKAEGEHGLPFMEQSLVCGTGGGLESGPEEIELIPCISEVYSEGQHYSQNADEIHVSAPDRGTVTLVNREMLEDEDRAYVFWPAGEEWVSAEPRPASPGEVEEILGYSLDKYFGGR